MSFHEFCFRFFASGVCVDQSGLKLIGISDLPASVSWVTTIIGVYYHAWFHLQILTSMGASQNQFTVDIWVTALSSLPILSWVVFLRCSVHHWITFLFPMPSVLLVESTQLTVPILDVLSSLQLDPDFLSKVGKVLLCRNRASFLTGALCQLLFWEKSCVLICVLKIHWVTFDFLLFSVDFQMLTVTHFLFCLFFGWFGDWTQGHYTLPSAIFPAVFIFNFEIRSV